MHWPAQLRNLADPRVEEEAERRAKRYKPAAMGTLPVDSDLHDHEQCPDSTAQNTSDSSSSAITSSASSLSSSSPDSSGSGANTVSNADAANSAPSLDVEFRHSGAAIKLDDRCACGSKRNKMCSNNQCKCCCVEGRKNCVAKEHQEAQVRKYNMPHVEQLNSAMKDGKTLYIKYRAETSNGVAVRPVRPLRWVKAQHSFQGYCLHESKEKRYLVFRILEVRDQPFD